MNIGILELGLFLPVLSASLLLTAYWVWMLVDAIRAPEHSYRAGTKVVWVLVIAITGWIGAGIYHVVGRPQRRLA